MTYGNFGSHYNDNYFWFNDTRNIFICTYECSNIFLNALKLNVSYLSID